MTDRNVPRLKKWPFLLSDAALLGLACWLVAHYPHPLAPWAGGLVAGCVIAAALVALWPFRLEYETQVRTFESGRLVDAATAIRNLEQVSEQIRQATAQWQGVQEHAGKTTQAAREIAERMTAEARAFSEFMTKANDAEKATLRLEVEKLRRSEGQWLQVLVHTLDHIHALYQAGARSGQPNLANQLATFQAACRDLSRRVGLTAVDAQVGQPFDAEHHDIVPGQETPAGSTWIAQVVAPGYSYQGQVLRRPIVALDASAPAAPSASAPETPVAGSIDPAELSAVEQPVPDGPIGETPVDPAASTEEGTIEAVSVQSIEETSDRFVATTQAGDELIADPSAAAIESGAPDSPQLTGAAAEDAPGAGSAIEEFRLESDPIAEARLRRRAGNG